MNYLNYSALWDCFGFHIAQVRNILSNQATFPYWAIGLDWTCRTLCRGVVTLKRGRPMGMCGLLRPPFYASQEFPIIDPIPACFSSVRPPFKQKLQILQNWPSWSLYFRKISAPKPEIWPKIQFFKPYFSKKSVQPLFLVLTSSLSPICGPSGRTPIPKWKFTPWLIPPWMSCRAKRTV